ncbi:MAG: phenylalanine--tRNA ligase subunit alpha [Rhodobacteraceae bacterium]|nr:phenylalanine--tRNA ligase subunit alpha [Paracoccaceae bacterium]
METLEQETLQSIAAADSEASLEALRLGVLGRQGTITQRLRGMGALDPDERKSVATALNRAKDAISQALRQRRDELEEAALDRQMQAEWLDITLPARPNRTGSVHPVSQTMDEVAAIFADMGFGVAEGPQIETDWHNFDALNIPPDHPARQEHDTFFIRMESDGGSQPNVLRTHTSPVQVRTMQERGAPLYIVAPGRVYRCDYDQTHTPMFHQTEGLAIDRDITMANLKWVLEEFCRAYFEVDAVELRFRASHFPFTEPSAEVDLRCSWQDGQLKVGEGDDWMEIIGCGMVHPRVLEAGRIDPSVYQGFAFGIGIDRLAMLKYGIPDLRAFYESDVRWLRHYSFEPLDIPTLHGGLSR